MITHILIEILTYAAGVAVGLWLFIGIDNFIDWIFEKIRRF